MPASLGSARCPDITDETPASIELFRRAFAQNEEAWQAVRVLYEPLMRSWIGSSA